MVNYIKLTLNPKIRITVNGVAHLNLEGSYFNGSFGSRNNTLTVQYRYKPENGSYGSWATATATVSNNTYTASPTISGLNYQTRYIFQIKSQDKLMTVPSADILAKALPVFDWSENDFNFNVPVTFSAGFSGSIDLIYPVGSIYMSVNSTNPSTLFGGTWKQIAKGRTLVGVDTNDADFNTVQKTGGSKTHQHPLSSLGGANIRKYSDKFVQGNASTAGSFPPESDDNYWVTDANSDYSSETKPYSTDMAGVGLYGYTDAQRNLQPYFTCYIWCRTA